MKTQMTIGKKFALTGAFLIGMTLLQGVATLTGLVRINRALSSVADDALVGVSACSKVEGDLLEIRGDSWRHVASTDPSDKAYIEQEVQRLKDQVETDLKAVASSIFTDEERQLNQKIRPLMARYYQAWDNVREVSRAGRNAEAYRQYIAEATPAFVALKTAVGAETEYNRTSGAKDAAAARATENGVKLLIWAILIVSTFAGGGLLFLIVRRMNRALRETVSELSSGASQVRPPRSKKPPPPAKRSTPWPQEQRELARGCGISW
jgi:cell division septum initiation protein DivIVA